jgi:hypothetical protein
MLLDNLLCGGMREDGGTLRWNSTLEELNLGENDLGEVGGRTQTEALRLNATLTSLNLYLNDMGQGGGGCWQRHCAGTARSRTFAFLVTNWEWAEGRALA